MIWKTPTRFVLHNLGGLPFLRWKNQDKFGILTFHAFSASNRANLDILCTHIASHFEPLTLSQVTNSLKSSAALPKKTITVTVDDGYKSFLEYGLPVFRKHRLPVTLNIVSGFADARFWLWFDQIEFALQQTPKSLLQITLDGQSVEFPLESSLARVSASAMLKEALKVVPNSVRKEFVANLGAICGVDIPLKPPEHLAGMNWEDLRSVVAEGIEIGCHTDSHPVLSRVSDPVELTREIDGAKRLIEEHLGLTVQHFCYPNGRDIDISELAIRKVVEAGYESATTGICGFNDSSSDRFRLKRIAFDPGVGLLYGAELLAGLHM